MPGARSGYRIGDGKIIVAGEDPTFSHFVLARFGTDGSSDGSFGTNGQNGSVAYVGKNVSEQVTFTRELSTGFMPDRDYRSLAFGSETGYHSGLGRSDAVSTRASATATL